MKQTKRIALTLGIVAVVVLTAIALAGCNNRPSKLFAGEAQTNAGPLAASTVYTQINGENIVGNALAGTDLVWFTKTDASGNQTFSMYNYKTGIEIIPFTSRLGVEYLSDAGVLIVTETNVYNEEELKNYSFYDSEGGILVIDAPDTYTTQGSDYVVVGETAYLLDNGKLMQRVPVGTGLDEDFLAYDYKSDNYFFCNNDGYVKVFASDGSFVRSVNTDKYATAATNGKGVFYLSSDRIVVQYENVRPDDATRYDYFRYNTKFELKTYIYNVEKDKWSEKTGFKYLIGGIIGTDDIVDESMRYDESVTDIMRASKFSKKSLSAVESMYSVNKNLKIGVEFDELLEGYTTQYAVEGGGYVLTKVDGTEYYYSDDGKTVTPLNGTVTGKYYVNSYNSVFRMDNGELKFLRTYSNEYSLLSIFGDYAMFLGPDGVYGGIAGGELALIETTGISVSYYNVSAGFYVVTDSTKENVTYSIYSHNGTALRTNLAAAVEVICSSSEGSIVKSGNEIIRIA